MLFLEVWFGVFCCFSGRLGAVISTRALLSGCVTPLLLISRTFLHLALSQLIPLSSSLSMWSRTHKCPTKICFSGQMRRAAFVPPFHGAGSDPQTSFPSQYPVLGHLCSSNLCSNNLYCGEEKLLFTLGSITQVPTCVQQGLDPSNLVAVSQRDFPADWEFTFHLRTHFSSWSSFHTTPRGWFWWWINLG